MSFGNAARVGQISKPRKAKPLPPRLREMKKILTETDLDLANIAWKMGITNGSAKVYGKLLYKLENAGNGRITLLARENQKLRDLVDLLTRENEKLRNSIESLTAQGNLFN